MQEDYYFYEPKLGHGLKHDPINAIVGPRVIGWIGSKNSSGSLNLAPYSFFNLFNYRPPIIAFSSLGYKDSLRNVLETGVFTWNLVSRDLAEPMNLSSIEQAVPEFEFAGLTALDSRHIDAPRVGESLVSFECRLTQHLRLQDLEHNELDTWMVFGEVIGVHIAPSCLVDGVYNTSHAQPVLRGGGAGDYFSISDEAKFVLRRPK